MQLSIKILLVGLTDVQMAESLITSTDSHQVCIAGEKLYLYPASVCYQRLVFICNVSDIFCGLVRMEHSLLMDIKTPL